MSELAPPRWVFPDPRESDDDIVAVGADLEPATILSAYQQGLFPMPLTAYDEMSWWSPLVRGVLPLGSLRITRSMRQSARRFTVTIDQAFDEVVVGCADRTRPGAWIDDRIAAAYRRLYRDGWAHSVEVWKGSQLAGGLYGVAIGGLFAGESMFHRVTDASKVALMALVDLLDDGDPRRLVDVQWATPHLETLGVTEVARDDYLMMLAQAVAAPLPTMWR